MNRRVLLLVALLALTDSGFAADLIIHGGTVIDGTGAPPRRGVDVTLRGGAIASISEICRHSPGARVIDASGMFVVPGFIDMHAHLLEHARDEKGELKPRTDWALTRHMLDLLMRFGVTTVRDPGSQTEAAVTLRNMVNAGKVRGPRIFTAGRIINASRFDPEPFQPVVTADDVRREVRWQALAGVDFIKIYGSTPPELAKVAIEEAHARGLPVIGHLQRTTWTEAARLGIDFIAHGAPWSPEYLPAAARKDYPQTLFGRVYWLQHLDIEGPPVRELIRVLAERRVAVDPTLIAYHTKFFGNQPRWLQNPDNALMPEVVLTGWRSGSFTKDWTPSQYADAREVWPKELAFIKALHDGGVLLTVGTDAPTPWIVPGPSFHEELKLLRDAGIAEADLLRMATYNAARALKREKEFGSVREGLRADLVILRKNPLERIENTRSIAYVIQRGGVVHEAK